MDSTRHTFTLGKTERLKSRKLIDRVFQEGRRFALFPFRVCYCVSASPAGVSTPPSDGSTPSSDVFVPRSDGFVAPAGSSPLRTPAPGIGGARLQAGFGASSRNFKKAVDRNRIKRLTREAYRVQKQELQDHLTRHGLFMAVFFIYTGKELPDHAAVKEKIGVVLKKLVKATTS